MRTLARTLAPIGALASALAITGCASSDTTAPISQWVSADCHAAAAPFSTFRVAIAEAPGFKEPILREALVGALTRQGLALDPKAADLDVTLRVSRIDHSPAPPPRDAMDAPQPTQAESRFMAHADVEVVDRRDGRLIYKAALDRNHRISGASVLHSERAEAMIAVAMDRALTGLRTACTEGS